jgi:hypothetical protein
MTKEAPKSEARRKFLAHDRGHSIIRALSFFWHSSFGFRHYPEPPQVGRDKVMNDFKFAFRQLLKNPGFTAVAVITPAP